MKHFKLTIAETELDRRVEGTRNLRSMLSAFVISFSVTLISGYWYRLVPREINWNASQTVLVLHLAGGVISLIVLLVFYFLHQRHKKQPPWLLLAPWRLRREDGEAEQRFRQRQLGHVLTWCLILVYGSGLLIALPGVMFYFGRIWMQGYYTVQGLARVHFWGGLVMLVLMGIHMLWIARKGK